MKAFKSSSQKTLSKYDWNNWSALYLSDGGIINMRLVYTLFYKFLLENKNLVSIYDGCKI